MNFKTLSSGILWAFKTILKCCLLDMTAVLYIFVLLF